MSAKKSGSKKTASKKRRAKASKSKVTPVTPFNMEKMMRDMTRLLDEQEFETTEEANAFLQNFAGEKIPTVAAGKLTPVEQAQEKIYEAQEATSRRERKRLAREALKISSDCADAYVLLADEARNAAEAKELYEEGVRAGERALGVEAFAEDAGSFWGLIETRPYMRARRGLAEALWELGRRREAIEHYAELLRLNPNDNQGVRYILANALLGENEDERLGKLLDDYKDDAAATWAYTRALWTFRREGASARAGKSFDEAFAGNPFVPLLMFGLEEMPEQLPDYVGFGDKNEAVVYVYASFENWIVTPGALEWMIARVLAGMGKLPGKMPARRATKAKTAKRK